MSNHQRRRGLMLQLWGRILFVLCALLFIASSIRNQDRLSLAASLLFLAACAFFIIPLIRELKT